MQGKNSEPFYWGKKHLDLAGAEEWKKNLLSKFSQLYSKHQLSVISVESLTNNK